MTKLTILVYSLLLFLVIIRIYTSCSVLSGTESTREICSVELKNSAEEVGNIHNNYDKKIQKYLPSPHAELLLGMTIGADYLDRLNTFYDMLKNSGTIHVAVVSGFNINLVFNFLVNFLGSKYKFKNYLFATVVTLSYAFISGFEPPVVRAWIMGSTIALGKVYGRLLRPFYVLFLTAILMILYKPAYAFSLSFQLSSLATLGLIIYSEPVKALISRATKSKSILLEDFTASVSAQILVWPLISYKFGTISLISPLSNALLLWTIPISTILGFCLLLSLLFSNSLSYIFSNLSFVFIDIFVKGVKFFSGFRLSSISFTLSYTALLIYYFIILLLPLISKKLFQKKVTYEN